MTALKEFVSTATDVLGRIHEEEAILATLKPPFAALIAKDDWLPAPFAQPHADYYQQYLLHCDPLERFSVVSFVWGPGQMTPIHNHTVWGLVGVLRGAEVATRYAAPVAGQPMVAQADDRLEPGMVDMVSPQLGDIHRVRNAFEDRVSISIHVYGGNIGKVHRQVFDPETGLPKSFVSGFSSDVLPNIWA